MKVASASSAIEVGERPSIWALAAYFLRLGTFGFGGPIALAANMQRDLVDLRRWISQEEYLEGLALAQLAPGPLAAQLAMYLGYLLHGFLGATVVAVTFVAPSFLMVVALGEAYVRYGGLPWMQSVFYGVGAAVIGIIARSSIKLIQSTLKRDLLLWVIFAALGISTAMTEREIVWLFLAGGLVTLVTKTALKWQLQFAVTPVPWLLPKVLAESRFLAIFGFFAKAGLFVLAIYEPHQWEETIMYLVEGKSRALLFDTGMGIGDLKRVVSHLTSLPIVAVNSHTHPDHTGGNWQFPTIYSLDTDYTRMNARGSTEIRAEIEPGKLCGALPKSFDPATYATRPWKSAKWLHDGDTIDLGGRTLRVLATPGHAPDSLCLFDEANRLLFTGDTYYPGTIYVFSPGADPIAYQQTVHRLAKLAPKVHKVLGAHNEPIAAPAVLAELAREFDAVRAGKIPGTSAGDGITQYKGEQMTFLVRTGHK